MMLRTKFRHAHLGLHNQCPGRVYICHSDKNGIYLECADCSSAWKIQFALNPDVTPGPDFSFSKPYSTFKPVPYPTVK